MNELIGRQRTSELNPIHRILMRSMPTKFSRRPLAPYAITDRAMFKQVPNNFFEPDENMLPNVHGLNRRYHES